MQRRNKKRMRRKRWLGKHKPRKGVRQATKIQQEEFTKLQNKLFQSIQKLDAELTQTILSSNPNEFTNEFLAGCYRSLWNCGLSAPNVPNPSRAPCKKTESKLEIISFLVEIGGLNCDLSDEFYVAAAHSAEASNFYRRISHLCDGCKWPIVNQYVSYRETSFDDVMLRNIGI